MAARRANMRGLNSRVWRTVIPLSALMTWVGLLIFTGFVPPQSLQALVVVFVLLFLALTSTFIPLIYLIRKIFARRQLTSFLTGSAVRESILLTICIVFNLFLRLLHSWSVITSLLTLAIAAVIEVLMLGQSE